MQYERGKRLSLGEHSGLPLHGDRVVSREVGGEGLEVVRELAVVRRSVVGVLITRAGVVFTRYSREIFASWV